eukprot:GILI01019594.1.p1 GENE.GILI01019594.1~~GILI01019594.1.p1  ORF type:complete len:764 (-),score=134.33 GILI01019594.1:107-2260(-)
MQPFTVVTAGAEGDDGKNGEQTPLPSSSSRQANVDLLLEFGASCPQLSTMRVNHRPIPAASAAQLTDDEKRHIKQQLVCATFTVPASVLPNNKFPHVLLLQRPKVASVSPATGNGTTAAAAMSEGIEVGPVQPQPIGVELHLHRDPGDAQYVYGILSKPLNVQLYEDLLHPDGEVYVQFGPVEGAAVVDSEAAIKAFEQTRKAGDSSWGFPQTAPGDGQSTDAPKLLRAVGENSNFYVPVPRVVYNVPTGKTERRTPLESPKTTLSSSGPDDEMLASAAAAVKYFVEELIIKDQSSSMAPTSRSQLSYELDWDKARIDLAEHNSSKDSEVKLHSCNFCHRLRLKMMRCGGCKVTNYCCQDHQAKDWKGSHKAECKLLKVADEDFQQFMLPAIKEKKQKLLMNYNADPAPQIGTSSSNTVSEAENDSNVITFFKLLELTKLGLGDSFDEIFLGKIKQNNAATIAAAKKGTVAVAMTDQPATKIVIVHLLHLEDAYGFMASLAKWWRHNKFADLNGVQYRIVVANTKTTKASDQNKVFAIKESHEGSVDCSEVESTGVLGDVWRASGQGAQSPFLLRLYHDRYHHFAEKAMGSIVLVPDVVLSLGTKSLQGQGFFNAATETIADDVLGKIPFGFSEPHYLAAHRTLQGLHSRSGMSPVNRNPSYDESNNLLNKLIVNAEGLCLLPIESYIGSDGKEESAPTAVPMHLNAYVSVIVPLLK